MTGFNISARQRAVAKAQRRGQTTIEGLVWREFRAKRFEELKFKRQVPIGPFIADFACFEARLIVEVDGPDHDKPSRRERDRRRDAWFQEGFAVFRMTGEEVIGGPDAALARLRLALKVPSPASTIAEGERPQLCCGLWSRHPLPLAGEGGG
jgi:very-short-patch-repair endonuclease